MTQDDVGEATEEVKAPADDNDELKQASIRPRETVEGGAISMTSPGEPLRLDTSGDGRTFARSPIPSPGLRLVSLPRELRSTDRMFHLLPLIPVHLQQPDLLHLWLMVSGAGSTFGRSSSYTPYLHMIVNHLPMMVADLTSLLPMVGFEVSHRCTRCGDK
jgi:hypothetical protein